MDYREKYGFLIPVYNHGRELHGVLERLEPYKLPFIVVDDGSNQETKRHLQEICQAHQDMELVTLSRNSGKGGAVSAGIRHAFQQGYSHVFQIDADGQHDTTCCKAFIKKSRQFPEVLVCGEPVYDSTVPKSRQEGRKFGNTWAKIVTWSSDIRDAMCGFRIYPVGPCHKVISGAWILDRRMGFDLEILIRLKWKNLALTYLPVGITYPRDGVSHFHIVRDNARISLMFARSFLGMLLRTPLLAFRKITGGENKI